MTTYKFKQRIENRYSTNAYTDREYHLVAVGEMCTFRTVECYQRDPDSMCVDLKCCNGWYIEDFVKIKRIKSHLPSWF